MKKSKLRVRADAIPERMILVNEEHRVPRGNIARFAYRLVAIRLFRAVIFYN